MIRCVIVEDEPRAIQVLELFIGKLEGLELLAAFRQPLQALDFIRKEQVDLVFSDIQMPDLDGLQFVSLLPKSVMVIFTTAYPEYAVKSYDYEAIDYLLKPIAFNRFVQAVEKVKVRFSEQASTEAVKSPSTELVKHQSILIKSGSKMHRVSIETILYLEKDGHYITFYREGLKPILARLTMHEALTMLDGFDFFQVHKSFIVSFRALSIIERHQIQIGEKTIPIGKMYRDSFEKWVVEVQKK